MSEEDCNAYFTELKKKNVNMKKVYDDLLSQGLEAFKVSFKDLLSKLIN